MLERVRAALAYLETLRPFEDREPSLAEDLKEIRGELLELEQELECPIIPRAPLKWSMGRLIVDHWDLKHPVAVLVFEVLGKYNLMWKARGRRKA